MVKKLSETTNEKESSIERGHETEKSVTCQEQHKTVESKDVVAKPDKETNNIVKPQFECDLCGAKYKNEITTKKHFNTKHKKTKTARCVM